MMVVTNSVDWGRLYDDPYVQAAPFLSPDTVVNIWVQTAYMVNSKIEGKIKTTEVAIQSDVRSILKDIDDISRSYASQGKMPLLTAAELPSAAIIDEVKNNDNNSRDTQSKDDFTQSAEFRKEFLKYTSKRMKEAKR